MDKKKLLMVMIVAACIGIIVGLTIPVVSAAEWDNVKSYDANDREITIKDSLLGIPTTTVAEIKLLSDPHLVMFGEIDYAFEIEITNYENEYNGFMKKIETYDYYNMVDSKSGGFTYKYYNPTGAVEVEDFKETCNIINGTNVCTYEKTGSHTENTGAWESFNEKANLPSGTVKIRGYWTGPIAEGERIEWIPTMFGVRINEWADFGAATRGEGFDNLASDTWAFFASGGPLCQSFTHGLYQNSSSMSIVGATIEMGIFAADGNNKYFNATLQAADSGGVPNTTQLDFSGQHEYVGPPGVGNQILTNISFSSNTTLFAGRNYSICLHSSYVGGNEPFWAFRNEADGYEGSAHLHFLGGAAYGSNADDGKFWIWGGAVVPEPPTTALNSPADQTDQLNSSVIFNCSATDDVGVVNISLWIDNSINFTLTNSSAGEDLSIETQVDGLSIASHSWTCDAWDGVENEGGWATNRTVNISAFTENSITYDASITEGALSSFVLNLTADGGQSVTGTLFYSNATQTTSKSGGDDEMEFSSTLSGNESGTHEFWWELVIGSTFYNSTKNSQTVSPLNLTNCADSGDTIIFNFTVYDEGTKTQLDGGASNLTLDLDFDISSIDGSPITNYSKTETFTNPVLVCTSTAPSQTSVLIDGLVRYEANSSYISEFYTIQNFSFNVNTTNTSIALYDLLSDDAQEFKITYKDQNFLPVSDAILDVQRYYIGDGVFRTVEQPPFDTDGDTLANLVLGDVIYNLIVKRDGEILGTFTDVKAFCDNAATGDCTINLNSFGSSIPIEDFRTIDDLTFTLTYTKATRTVSSTFSTTDGSNAEMNLNVTLFDMWGNNTLCTDTLTSSSGTLSCVIPDTYGNSSAIGELYRGGTAFYATIRIPLWDDKSTIYGANYVTLGILSFLTIVGIGLASSGIIMILFILLGVAVNAAFFLIDQGGFIGGTATFLWLVIALAAIAWKASRRQS